MPARRCPASAGALSATGAALHVSLLVATSCDAIGQLRRLAKAAGGGPLGSGRGRHARPMHAERKAAGSGHLQQ